MAEENKRSVTLSRQELNEAIIMYAAGKARMKYPLKHSVEINGVLTAIKLGKT